jgi:CRISPR-associated protein Cas6
MDELRCGMVDVAFALAGDTLPREHRRALAEALTARLPWLAELPRAGVHRINVSAGAGPQALLSHRSRLTLRVPREHADRLAVLAGAELDLGGRRLRLEGPPQLRELLPHGTLYAHVVAAEGGDELDFLAAVDVELGTLGVAGRCICGRQQALDGGELALSGYSLMLDGLSPDHARRLLEAGIGPHRLWGCGLFVPHKSAAAVGH